MAYRWQNSDLQNIGDILENGPNSGALSYNIKNVRIQLTDTTANGEPLPDPSIGLVIGNAIFISIENTSESQDITIDGETIEAGDPILTYPNANNVEQDEMIIKCSAGATATIIYQYKQSIS